MAGMYLDLEAIDGLATNLARVARQFDDAVLQRPKATSSFGDNELATMVGSFVTAWEQSRSKISEAITTLSGSTAAVAKTWRDIDQEAANAIFL